MATTVNLRPGLDRKIAQMMTPCPTANAAGMFIINDPSGAEHSVVYVCSVSVIYRYVVTEDAWTELPASGIAGTFAAGACGAFHKHGPTGTATGGSTTTINTNLTIPRSLAGSKVLITAGPNAGEERTILSNTFGANSIITVSVAFSGAITAASVYRLLTGQYWFLNAGTTAIGFAVYDKATNAWTQRSVTGLPTAWGTEGRLIAPFGARATFATGTATAGGASTLTNSAKTWTTNQWTNYQVRITAGTGAGQTRTIASNTGTVLTTSAAWTTQPDATSVYAIEGNDDHLYLLGNNAVTMYRYTISTNTWATISPGAARTAAMGAGGGANWICDVDDDATWTNESDIKNGRYIISFRGGATVNYDIYDIALNTWAQVTDYGYRGATFTTGSCYEQDGRYIYISKENTGRIFRYDFVDREMYPWTTIVYPNSTATVGDKMFEWTYIDGATKIKFFYHLGHTLTTLMRVMDI